MTYSMALRGSPVLQAGQLRPTGVPGAAYRRNQARSRAGAGICFLTHVALLPNASKPLLPVPIFQVVERRHRGDRLAVKLGLDYDHPLPPPPALRLLPEPTRMSGFPRVTAAVKSEPRYSPSTCQFTNLDCWVCGEGG